MHRHRVLSFRWLSPFQKVFWDESEKRTKKAAVFANRISWRKITITSLTEVTARNSKYTSQKKKNRCSECYTNVLCADPKSARNILINLSPNPARAGPKPDPTYNSTKQTDRNAYKRICRKRTSNTKQRTKHSMLWLLNNDNASSYI